MKPIIAELRRSAIQDQRPWINCAQVAWGAACNALTNDEVLDGSSNEQAAMFFLIVAAAMEGEA